MTQTTSDAQNSARRGVNTIYHLFEIAAPRETVFNSLTTEEGLSAWWTTGVKAEKARVGANIDFTFRGPFNPHMQITELDPPVLVGLKGVGGHDAWGENTIRFKLDATSSGTMVHFWHQLGRELSDEVVAIANFSWGYYLDSLRLLCETGSGKPFQVGNARARVGANDTMDSYTKTLHIHASPQKLYQAITTIVGLKSWWTENTVMNNYNITFGFSDGVFQTMRLLEATPDKKVVWECIAQYFPVKGTDQTDEWVGTRVLFTIQANQDETTTLVFTHYGLTPQVVCYDQCNEGWDHFLESLKRFVEQGKGMPYMGTAWRTQRTTAS